MLLNLREYHRPGDAEDVQRVLELLARRDVRTMLLAGGDALVGAADPTVEAVVDLQALAALDFISANVDTPVLRVGAMTTRTALTQYLERETDWSQYRVVAESARRWSGSVQRNRATVGGAIATAASDDPLVVALLACNAQVTLVTRPDPRSLSLAEFLPARAVLLTESTLIVEVSVPLDRKATWALASVARTPSDAPIVIAVAMLAQEHGRCAAARVALGGVAEMPIVLPEIEAAVVGKIASPDLFAEAGNRAASLVQPSGDFRGSAEYRRAMAGVLTERALNMAWRQMTSDE
jgi:aerobic carbon-monoxide dehydrogenase medium subunit